MYIVVYIYIIPKIATIVKNMDKEGNFQ